MWATSVPILVFLGLSVLDLGPMYATDRQRRQTGVRQTDVRQHHRLMSPPRGGAYNNEHICNAQFKQPSNAPLLHYGAGVESFKISERMSG